MARATSKGFRPAVILVTSGLIFMGLAAHAAPVQWTGNSGGAWVKLFVDGQKATGAIRSQLPEIYAEVELSGSGSGSQYAGTLQGIARRAGNTTPLTGEWRASTGSGAALHCTIRPTGKPVRTLDVPLQQSAGYALLRCAWLRGTATRTSRGSAAPVPLKANDPVAIGDSIETGPQSGAIVILGDRSVVMMQEKTRLLVPDVPDNRTGVQKAKVGTGKVWFAVKKVQDRGKFEVETDEAVAAVRGTEFLVEVGDEGETSITTAEGEVAITDAERKRPFTPCRAGMRWALAARRLRRGAFWGGPRAHDLRTLVQTWRPMLEQADIAWPLRREGKRAFWQDSLVPDGSGGFQAPGRGAGPRRGRMPGPGARPGFRRGR